MEPQCVDLDKTTFRLITFPLCGINLFSNIFYGYCLISNRHKLRQPLKVLVTFLVWCTIAYVVHLFGAYPLLAEITDRRHHLIGVITMFIAHSSMMTTVSMSFYYYVKIVPSQRGLLIWIKRNIKSFIYWTFLLHELIIAFSSSLNILSTVLESWVASANNCTYNQLHVAGLKATSTAVFTFVKVHLLWCMAIGGVCNLSMAYYLFKHIRSRTLEGFAATGSQGQKQVAVSEFVQTVLFFICIMLYFALTFDYANQFIFGPLLYLTVLLLYMTGTTASLAIGQAIFRRGAVDVWKALTALCCASG